MRRAAFLATLILGWPLIHAPALRELPQVDRWRLMPHLIPDRIVRAAGPRLANLSLAIAWRESKMGWYVGTGAKLVHHNGNGKGKDQGVFQVNEFTARALHLWNPLDPDLNIAAGVGLIKTGFAIYGTDAGAACYFAHPSRCWRFK